MFSNEQKSEESDREDEQGLQQPGLDTNSLESLTLTQFQALCNALSQIPPVSSIDLRPIDLDFDSAESDREDEQGLQQPGLDTSGLGNLSLTQFQAFCNALSQIPPLGPINLNLNFDDEDEPKSAPGNS